MEEYPPSCGQPEAACIRGRCAQDASGGTFDCYLAQRRLAENAYRTARDCTTARDCDWFEVRYLPQFGLPVNKDYKVKVDRGLLADAYNKCDAANSIYDYAGPPPELACISGKCVEARPRHR
jgi:hypothetical protein